MVAMVMVGCGGSSSNTPAASTSATPWTDTAMQTLVKDTCATSSCHGGTSLPNYSSISESAMKADTTAKTDMLTKKTMPKGGSLTATQIQTVTNFYK